MIDSEKVKELNNIVETFVGRVVRIKPGFLNFMKEEIVYISNANVSNEKRYNKIEDETGWRTISVYDDEYYKFTFSIKSYIQAHSRTFNILFRDDKSLIRYLETTFEPRYFDVFDVEFIKNKKAYTAFTKNSKEKIIKSGEKYKIIGVFKERNEKWDWNKKYKYAKKYFSDFRDGTILNDFEYYTCIYLKDKNNKLFFIKINETEYADDYMTNII